MKAIIIGNANIESYDFYIPYFGDAYIICCDGGLRHAKAWGIMPDVIIGDFDSISSDLLGEYRLQGITIKGFSPEKDFTDMELGIQEALGLSPLPSEIIIFGGIGNRLDHTLSNLTTLKKGLEKGIITRLIDERHEVTLIDEFVELTGEKGDIVSLVPLTTLVKGITTKGLYYSLTDGTLGDVLPTGISNVMTDCYCSISVREGQLLVMKVKEKESYDKVTS